MRISKRLKVISELIPNNSFFLDIGCDHALLDIYTVLNNEKINAIASDINIGPLKSAKENVSKYKLENRIKIVQSDGLDSSNEKVDTVVLSGLGSNTIVNILKKGKEKLNTVNNIIVSTNNDYYYLRKNVLKLGYYIQDEKIVLDKGKYYIIILFNKGENKEKYSKLDLKYGKKLNNKNDELYKKYLYIKKNKLLEIYKQLNVKHIIKKINLKREIRYIDRLLSS